MTKRNLSQAEEVIAADDAAMVAAFQAFHQLP
jgi:hypothetical protein